MPVSWALKFSKNGVRTQFLRNRLQNTSIKVPILAASLPNFFSSFFFFLCDKRGSRGAREQKLSHTEIKLVVADVAIYEWLPTSRPFLTTQFDFEVRKKCVKLRFLQFNPFPHHFLKHLTQGIDNPLLLSILVFFTLFCFIGGYYGNNS